MLERFFFLDDADRDLVAKRRGDHNRLGFALQLVTVRHVGAFLADPLDVPLAVLGYVAAQIGVTDPSSVRRYTERDKTRLEHQWEIAGVHGFASFASAEAALVQWLDDEAWTTGDGPRALFYAAVAWLREGKVLLPGVTTLVELVATVRQAAEDRLYGTLAASVTAGQARSLEAILDVPEGRRRSQLDLWRRGERSTTGRGMVLALDRVAEIAGLGMREAGIASVPTRRVIELARYGIAAKAPKLGRHPYRRKIATLLATVRWLEVTATDDALELFDVFMSSELIGRARRRIRRSCAGRPDTPGTPGSLGRRWRCCSRPPGGARTSPSKRCGRRSTARSGHGHGCGRRWKGCGSSSRRWARIRMGSGGPWLSSGTPRCADS